jgi:hypothetical protein
MPAGAALRGQTLKQFVEEALEQLVEQPEKEQGKRRRASAGG